MMLGYAASILMGLTLGLMGGGGAIMTVPILVYLFSIEPLQATSYSLFIVGFTALLGGLTELRRGQVDLKTGLIFAVPSFLGVYITRALILPSLPLTIFRLGSIEFSKSLLIMLAFAVVMIFASLSMIRGRHKKSFTPLSTQQKWTLIPLQGVLVGVVSGFVGAGGGFLIVPALVMLVGLRMKVAVGTSLFIIAANSLIGFLGDVQHEVRIDWHFLLTIVVIAVVGLFIGLRLSAKVSDTSLKKGFGYFVLFMGMIISFDQIRRL